MSHNAAVGRWLLGLVAATVVVRCTVREDVLDERPFPCASSADCGTTRSGGPMTCYPGDALGGGTRFCAPACDPTRPVADPEHTLCDGHGALLYRCHPTPTASPEADCPAGLRCYRTSLVSQEGVCLDMPVCDVHGGCDDPNHPTCAAALLEGQDASTSFYFDHLNCMHAHCEEQSSACANGEGCLGAQYGSPLADICVPPCSADLQCPPNYSCLRSTSGPAAPSLCVPGIPGDRCAGESSCAIGTCDDTGAGFSVCATPCSGLEALCSPFDRVGYPFFCVPWAGGSHCITPTPFHGSLCLSDSDCDSAAGEFCARTDPTGEPVNGGKNGECRVSCKADGTCDPRGGLPHTCAGTSAGCFPGELGLPCTLDGECLDGLSCTAVPPEPDSLVADAAAAARICTVPCGGDSASQAEADGECAQPGTVIEGGHCAAGFCRAGRAGGRSCTRNAECLSASCNQVTGTCSQPGSP